ncbi:MAG: Nif3-like dinuclear metal center hexameric protein [Planctomycetales bacterium]
MATIGSIADFLETFAPIRLAEDWDNVGLLIGDRGAPAHKVMTCLTVTPDSADEAVAEQVDLIVAHHPMMFRPIQRITTDQPEGSMLWNLIRAGVSVYSPHTAFDSAGEGINQHLAEGLILSKISPIVPAANPEDADGLGSGRWGTALEGLTLADVAARLKQFLGIDHVQIVGDPQASVRAIGVACGAAGGFLSDAQKVGCDCFVTGETPFHFCLEAEARGVGMILVGHYASERFAVEILADVLAKAFQDLEAWPSRREHNPLRLL